MNTHLPYNNKVFYLKFQIMWHCSIRYLLKRGRAVGPNIVPFQSFLCSPGQPSPLTSMSTITRRCFQSNAWGVCFHAQSTKPQRRLKKARLDVYVEVKQNVIKPLSNAIEINPTRDESTSRIATMTSKDPEAEATVGQLETRILKVQQLGQVWTSAGLAVGR